MEKQYIIRLQGYYMDGHVYYPENCSVGIHSIYKEFAEAEKAKLKLEKKLFVGHGVAFNHLYKDETLKKELSEFFENKYSFSVWADDSTNDLKAPIYIPKNISLEDTHELINILGCSFFEIVEKNEKALFYQIEINNSAWQEIIPEDVFPQIRIFPRSIFLNEYSKGIRLYNTSQEAYEYGVFKLVRHFKDKKLYLSRIENIHFKKESFFTKLLNIADSSQLDERQHKVYFKSIKHKNDFYSLISSHEILTVIEEEMWDLLYARLNEFEEEIRNSWEMGTINLESLSLEYGIPDFFIEMLLDGELEEEDVYDDFDDEMDDY